MGLISKLALPSVLVAALTAASLTSLRDSSSSSRISNPVHDFLEDGIISFDEAVSFPEHRQEYIDSIITKNPSPENIPVFYTLGYVQPADLASKGLVRTMNTVFISRPMSSKIEKEDLKIEVYEEAFYMCKSESEFLSSLVDHEYAHVKSAVGQNPLTFEVPAYIHQEIKDRVFSVTGDLFEPFQELMAYQNQINSFRSRTGISSSFKKGVKEVYSHYREEVKNKPPTAVTYWLLDTFPALPRD